MLLNFLPSQKQHQQQQQQHQHNVDFMGDATGGLTWSEFRRYGCGWWIHSDAILMQCAEKVCY